MSSHGDATVHDFPSARAAARRANGAKSKGPTTPEGKARASQNALKHGFCAKEFLLLHDDSRAEFAALESALLADLRPEGVLETLLARRLIAAAWRLARADRLEFELLTSDDPLYGPDRVRARDGGAERAFATLVRYRSGAQTEFFSILKALKERQAERVGEAEAPGATTDGAAAPRSAVAEERLPRPTLQEVASHETSGEAEPGRPEVRSGGLSNEFAAGRGERLRRHRRDRGPGRTH